MKVESLGGWYSKLSLDTAGSDAVVSVEEIPMVAVCYWGAEMKIAREA